MSDILAGTTLEDLEYSDEGDELESEDDDLDQVKYDKQRIYVTLMRRFVYPCK